MKVFKIFWKVGMLSIIIACNQNISDDLIYIDPVKPSMEPMIFAKGFITKKSVYEFGSVFNEEGNEFFFAIDSAGRSKIKYTEIKNGKWIEPITIISHPDYGFNDPFLSPSEEKLYYISDQPRNKQDTIIDHDIWYSKRDASNWSATINAGSEINSDRNEYYMSFTNDGSMYFSANKEYSGTRSNDFDIYKSEFIGGAFQKPVKLSDSINTGRYEADVFVSPDETYLIFCAAWQSGLGRGDLYISFKDENGDWTKAVNMGDEINSEEHELCPFVTRDGKYLFYTSNQDIYWVSTEILNQMKSSGLKN